MVRVDQPPLENMKNVGAYFLYCREGAIDITFGEFDRNKRHAKVMGFGL